MRPLVRMDWKKPLGALLLTALVAAALSPGFAHESEPVEEPYVVHKQWRGHLACTVQTPATGVNTCGFLENTVPGSTTDAFRHEWSINEDLQTVVGAFVWDSDEAAAAVEDELHLLMEVAGRSNAPPTYAEIAGASPLTFRVDAGHVEENYGEPLHGFDFNNVNGSLDLMFRVFAVGELNAVVSQSFHVYWDIYYGEAAPENATALPVGVEEDEGAPAAASEEGSVETLEWNGHVACAATWPGVQVLPYTGANACGPATEDDLIHAWTIEPGLEKVVGTMTWEPTQALVGGELLLLMEVDGMPNQPPRYVEAEGLSPLGFEVSAGDVIAQYEDESVHQFDFANLEEPLDVTFRVFWAGTRTWCSSRISMSSGNSTTGDPRGWAPAGHLMQRDRRRQKMSPPKAIRTRINEAEGACTASAGAPSTMASVASSFGKRWRLSGSSWCMNGSS